MSLQTCVNFKTDSCTNPSLEMRQAMVNAELGDDVYEDDATTLELEKYVADLTGKEAALFVPTGTFANQCALMSLTQRGDEAILCDSSRIIQKEQAGLAFLSAVVTRTLQGDKNGLMDLQTVESSIRKSYDIHFPTSRVICVENPTCQGYVPSQQYMKDIFSTSKKYGLQLHMDGTRIFNSAAYLRLPVKEIAQYCDSLSICLSKGLCAPFGALICGSAEFIKKCRYNRKLLGGGMRQTGVMAGPGLVGLKKYAQLLTGDHEMIQMIADEINKQLSDFIEKLDGSQFHTNILYFKIKEEWKVKGDELIGYLKQKANILIKLCDDNDNKYRVMTHYYIKEKEVNLLINTLKQFFYQIK